jgi:hypothetical protein
MKRSPSLLFISALGIAGAALGSFALAQDPKQSPQPESIQAAAPESPRGPARDKPGGATPTLGEIKIEKIPPQKVLSRQIQGGYERHQEVFADLKGTMMAATPAQAPAGKALALAADCLGIYPFDPDAVTDAASKARFEWGAALLVPQNFRLARGTKAKALSVPASDYKVQTLPAIEAGVMYSTIGRAPVDGLKFFPWMAENGYVQVGPTRMVYFTDPSVDLMRATPEQLQAAQTKIIVPIKKRARNISLKKQ